LRDFPGPVGIRARSASGNRQAALEEIGFRERTMEKKGIVFDIKRFALNDGPGLRTTVFLKGCPLSCSWCHNPESRDFQPSLQFRADRCAACFRCVEACPEGAVAASGGLPVTDPELCCTRGRCTEACPTRAREIVGREYSVGEIMEEVSRDRVFYEESGGGVTFSGGEPLSQPEFLSAALSACRQGGFHTVLDTSGFAASELFIDTASLASLVLFDIKAIDPEVHFRLTGVYNKEILDNLARLSEEGIETIIRIPLIPGMNDDEKNIRETGAYILNLESVSGVELLPFHPMAREKHARFSIPYRGPEAESYPAGKRLKAEELLLSMGVNVSRGEAD